MLFDMPQARREAVQVRLQDHAIVTMTGAELPTVRSAIDLSGGRDWGVLFAGALQAMVRCSVRPRKPLSSA